MGERQSDGRPGGRRRVHRHGAVSGHRTTIDTAGLEALLAAAVRADRIDAEAEQRAVAAFRAARDAGAHRTSRARRRDDWRPREQRRAGRPLKVTLSVLAASLTLGGAAFAAIGAAGSAGPGDDHKAPQSSASAPTRHTPEPSTTASGAEAGPDRPSTAQDTEAQCRAYEQVDDRGQALDATAWQRLIEAAGGEEKVAAYCTEQLARAKDRSSSGKSGETADPGDNGTGGTGNDNSNTGTAGSGNSGSGNAGTGNAGAGDSGTDNSAGSGADNSRQTSGQPSGGKNR
ncbi:pentapeptide repeat-containing protein [Streptomyces sp. S.PNR 29]|uniref:pentapeptide repeat-containing protein n=1 Tax=Streptomyces sp. S.PNR 29 TaxID=2973805 RepID=UPI0025AF2A38|nr:pentapeptide repeat-containing protein [Streptomyces sp. S.PNR 29]MDN0195300.1 pentapeptide repeat-containing protein [Streptomyces sp. S.PNR 29]